MSLKHSNEKGQLEGRLSAGSYMAESAYLKDYLRQMLVEYEPHLISLKALREQMDKKLGDQSLSELVVQMREESEH